MKKLTMAIAAIVLGAISLSACGTQIRSGQVGVRVNEVGSQAGVQDQELGVGWYFPQWGSYITKFPTTIRTEIWSDDERAGGPALQFNNADGVPTRVAVSILLRIDPTRASDAVQRYRLGFDELVDGPVRRRIQGAFVAIGSGPTFTSEALTSGPAAAQLLAAVRGEVEETLLREEGVIIEDLVLVGAPGLPEAIRDRINDRVEAEQAAQAEQARVATIEAQARQRVAQAEGEARAIELTGAALRANPQVLRQREIEKWGGLCPLDAEVCAPGGSLITSR